MESDETLIERVAAGDRLAMQALYARHGTRVFRFLMRLVQEKTMAEDLTADTFLEVWQRAGRFEKRASAVTWLLAIARFKALSARRRRRPETLDEEKTAAMEDDADTPEQALQKLDKAAAIRACLASLSAAHREVIDLVYYHDRSVEDVAAILDIPANTVKTRLFHARKQLSDHLAAAGIDRGWP